MRRPALGSTSFAGKQRRRDAQHGDSALPFGFERVVEKNGIVRRRNQPCLLYTSDAADERSSVDLGGRRIIKKKNKEEQARTGEAQINNTMYNIEQAKHYDILTKLNTLYRIAQETTSSTQ